MKKPKNISRRTASKAAKPPKQKSTRKSKDNAWRQHDPHARREAEKYENPIPSREFVLAYMRERLAPVTAEELLAHFDLRDPDQALALERRLGAMCRDGQLLQNRRRQFVVVNERELLRGHAMAHPDGFGFFVPEDGSEDMFLSPRQMRAVMHNDRVLVALSGIDRRGRKEGAVVEILERRTEYLVGRLFRERGVSFLVPHNRRYTQEVLVPEQAIGGARSGDMVVVRVVEFPTETRQPIGEVSEVLGPPNAPGMERAIAIRGHGLPYEWPDEVLTELTRWTDEISPAQIAEAGRKDLRELPLVTIDGSDARDFDDAVYARKTQTGWKLYVAIADVSSYVVPGSALDQEALHRGTSVYFPREVIPMLPEKLSNGLCSLNPNVDRLCLVAEMVVSGTGEVSRATFYPAVMNSKARFTYDEVADILAHPDSPARRKRGRARVQDLENLYALYRVFRQRREQRGAIELDTVETQMTFDAQGKITDIFPRTRNEAHKIIEECMIAANVAAAKHLLRHKMPALYRVHDGVKPDKVEDLQTFLMQFGLVLPDVEKLSPGDFSRLVASIGDVPERNLIETVLLRSLKHAEYLAENKGHFGLALPAYAHFTSPIRRYPDLMVHRAIKHIAAGGKRNSFHFSPSQVASIGEQSSMTEKRAEEASRDVVLALKCQFMQDRVGEEFDGIITGVTSFGLFVELQDVYVEGLVHITGLGPDYFQFDPVRHRLMGERTRQVFQLAGRLRARVVRVDIDDRKIDLELVSSQPEKAVKAARKSRSPKARKRRSRGKS